MTSCGKPSSRSCLSNRRSRGVVGHAWTPGRPSRASSPCSRAASRLGRCSPGRWAAGPARPAGGGCATGRRPGCGDACTGSCSTALAKPIGSTGRGLAWTRRACPQKGGERIGKTPTDRGEPGSKRHLVSDRKGVPLTIAFTAANVHDSRVFEEMVDAVEPIKRPGRGRPRKRPEKLHADKGYDFPRCRKALRRRGDKDRAVYALYER